MLLDLFANLIIVNEIYKSGQQFNNQMQAKIKEYVIRNRTNLIILLYALLFGIAGIYDLQISQSLVNRQSGWAQGIEAYGELPGIITILTAIFIYHKSKKHSSNARTLLYGFILLYSAFILFVYFGYILLKPFIQSLSPVMILASVLTFISVLFVKTSKVNFSETAFIFSKVTLMMGVFGYLLFVQPLKVFWGRIRYRDLEALYSDFTPWYIPNGISGHESFPSGHSAMGFVLISFFILFKNKKMLLKYGIYSFIVFWALAVAASRVIIGAHYLSDVIVGSMGIVLSYLYFSQPDRTKNI